ncbi:hypothetical protein PHYBLDRAFT_62971 [Phycomyces blakesleeanus NRRL 1555(-)]|uniref:Uncharacterized protein n=1 Tax=Phycomyces blakesleeanus (strain ATCC 8743b / DSM 1359 / FGSC 10004 / NBRC 33097 / NRRL 1555) TaxID=763407 RepID=A0A162UPH9_PHYB8|nr:hypothetical protein PHYBLDRAFT_62971 [Phycomyces blakesleeanus NRRL 1555(-)]OAD76833.1 hypothetical protein PHYBLDRAFT_62971 [Phycomyces blakesleeanus NRRL 1555(-)]|eukprot:XP_018294873.1 hypothetical protein PHYBLDRAFT_62971 [Phycomyces blakesleeanus NRRL 1555(-)]
MVGVVGWLKYNVRIDDQTEGFTRKLNTRLHNENMSAGTFENPVKSNRTMKSLVEEMLREHTKHRTTIIGLEKLDIIPSGQKGKGRISGKLRYNRGVAEDQSSLAVMSNRYKLECHFGREKQPRRKQEVCEKMAMKMVTGERCHAGIIEIFDIAKELEGYK